MAADNYALLIGVEDYSALDRSEGRAPGTSDVAGAAEDARVWLQQCLAWGLSPEKIRVCSSPAWKAEDVEPRARGAHFADASRPSLASALEWMAEALSRDEDSSGLITFSGHGEQAKGIVLCPADMTASSPGLLHLPAIRDLVGGPRSGSVTVVLDCCRETSLGGGRAAIGPRLRSWARRFRFDGPPRKRSIRILAACEPGGAAVSSVFGGRTMGAFTWALTSVLGQWRAIERDGVIRLDASYGEVLHRCRGLLQSLSFSQIPVLQGAPAVDRMAFLEPEDRAVRGRTVTEPSCRRRRRQLDPSELDFRVYLLRYFEPSGFDAVVAKVLVTTTSGTVETSQGSFELREDDEYWFVASDVLRRIGGGSGGTLELTREADHEYASEGSRQTWSGDVNGFHLVQKTPAPATWRSAASGWPAGAQVFETADQSVALALVVERDPVAGSEALRRLDFYQTGSEALFHRDPQARYTLPRRAGTQGMNSAYNQAICDFELFADLA